MVDILRVEQDGFHLVEVKSSTRVHDIHYHDMAFQCDLLRRCGYEVKSFARSCTSTTGTCSTENSTSSCLFAVEDCTKRVFALASAVAERGAYFKAVAAERVERFDARGCGRARRRVSREAFPLPVPMPPPRFSRAAMSAMRSPSGPIAKPVSLRLPRLVLARCGASERLRSWRHGLGQGVQARPRGRGLRRRDLERSSPQGDTRLSGGGRTERARASSSTPRPSVVTSPPSSSAVFSRFRNLSACGAAVFRARGRISRFPRSTRCISSGTRTRR